VDAGDREEINLHLKFTIVKSLKIFLFFSAIFGLLFYSCGKDCTDDQNPECPNYAPCKYAKETKANFRDYTLLINGRFINMFQHLPDYQEMSASAGFWIIDTTQKYDYWEWHIGADIIPMEKIVSRSNFPKGEEIPITLVVRKTPNKKCFPNDDGIDTLTKNYLAVDYHFNYDYPLQGVYEMQYDSHPTVKGKFKFKVYINGSTHRIDTFPDTDCSSQRISQTAYGTNSQVAFETATCPPPNDDIKKVLIIWLRRKAKGSNEFEMAVKYRDSNYTVYHATGKKIQ